MSNFEAITDKIIEALGKGIIPWKKPWTTGLPKNLVSKKDYRGINVFILMLSPFTSPYWLTYNQASSLKGNVKKGSKGTQIVFWKFSKVKTQKADGTDSEKSIPFLRTYTVFNLDQCENIDPKHIPVTHKLDFKPLETCENIITEYQNAPKLEEIGNRACYIPSMDTIQIPPKTTFYSIEEYYATLFHEEIHSTGSIKRLNRLDKGGFFGSDTYSKEELVAELGASFLCGMTGIETTVMDNTIAYIQSWIKRLQDDKKLIITAAAQAQKAVDFITGEKYEQHNSE